MSARKPRPVRGAVGKHAGQAQVVAFELAAEPEALELAFAEKRLFRRSGVDEAEAVDRIVDPVVRRQVRTECGEECEQLFRRGELVQIHLSRQQVVPEIPLAHPVEHELLLAIRRAGLNRSLARVAVPG
jgi:hypothetical protein